MAAATQKKQPAADPKKSGKKETLLDAAYQKTQGVILGDEETQAMVEKWKGHQDVFMDYVLRPCCLHVLYEDRQKQRGWTKGLGRWRARRGAGPQSWRSETPRDRSEKPRARREGR